MRKGPNGQADAAYKAVLAAVRRGSHLCAFYETEDDLLDLVIPFCAAGAQRGELCVWLMPDHTSIPVNERAVKALAERGTEVFPGREYYLNGPCFEREPVVCFWNDKLQQALASHQSGLCASGDTFWLQQNNWQAFLDYENDLNRVIAGKPMTVLCTYPLSVSKAGDLFEVVRAHEVALAKRGEEWAVIEAPISDKNIEAQDAARRILSLSPRERQVLDGAVEGLAAKMVAFNLGISLRTVEVHRSRMLRRLGVRTMAEAVGTLMLVRPVT